MILFISILAVLALIGIVATVRAVMTDGYHRRATDPWRIPDRHPTTAGTSR